MFHVSVAISMAAAALGIGAPGPVFPVAGAHRMGTEAAQRFGGGRGHLGQDVFAECGTPVVAAHDGTVVRSEFEGAAGNYVVVEGPDQRSAVYMHLRRLAAVPVGDDVGAGEPLGRVGRTGDADGCHLHFEVWTAPGWYRGGAAIDPYDRLLRWQSIPRYRATSSVRAIVG